jgi:hypothetical protein
MLQRPRRDISLSQDLGLIQAVPQNSLGAQNYAELLALWNERRLSESNAAEDWAAWDEQVLSLLSPPERKLFLDETLLAGRGLGAGKVNRLSKILLSRHWIFREPTNASGPV